MAGVWCLVNYVVSHVSVQDSFFVLGLQYLSNGILICLAASLGAFFFLNSIFITLDRYLDSGDFASDWKIIKPEVRVCVTMFVVCILFLALVLAFKP
jgi:hypothetical protein